MPEVILRTARWKWAVALGLAVIATVLLVVSLLGLSPRLRSRERVACSVIALAGFGYAFFGTGRYLRFIPSGFEVKERFRAPRFTRWSDVDEIAVASFPSSAGGSLSYHHLAGIRLRDGVSRAMTEECRRNREACGHDVLLKPNYGISVERFVAVLIEKKREADKS
jgi:hypothetical protein